MGFFKFIGTSLLWIYAGLLALTLWPGLDPPADFLAFNFTEPKALSGKFALNNRLDKAKLLFQGQIVGPEGLADHNGVVYTGLATGEIVRITKAGKLETVTKSEQYDEQLKKKRPGHPAGMKYAHGALYVADLALGVLKVDVVKGKSEVLVDAKQRIEGRRGGIPNDLDVASNGDVYWSDVCSDISFEGYIHGVVLAGPCGRLIRYNAESGKNEVLLRNLAGANGVSLAADESFVLVTEMLAYRVVKYHLKGQRAGEREVIVEGLPGIPDNIYPDGKAGFLVSIPEYVDEENTLNVNLLSEHPYVRRGIARVVALVRSTLRSVGRLYPDYDFGRIVDAIDGFVDGVVFSFKTNITCVVRFDKDGKILDAAYSTKLPGLSSAYVVGDELWLGSYKAPHIAKIPLGSAFPSLVK